LSQKTKRSKFAIRLGFNFALVAAMTAILAGVISYVAWSFAFENYVRENLQSTANYVARHASSAYQMFHGWEFSHGAVIPQVSAQQDITVQIFDNDDRLIYDERHHSPIIHGEAQGLFDEAIEGTQGTRELASDGENVFTAPVIVDFVRVGEVRVWAYSPTGLLTTHDLQLRNTVMIAVSASGIVAMMVSSFVGIMYSRRLVVPIRKVTVAAQRMRDGDENARSGLDGNSEIDQLGITFDKMADSIQNDRKYERRMMGDIAHEVRTPLMGIQSTAEAIEDGVYPADSEHLSIITNETKRLSRLTSALMELSRLKDDQIGFPVSLIDLNEPINAAVAVNSARAEALDLNLVLDLQPNIKVQANAERLQQAFTNLLSNSIRYTPEGGTVAVRTVAKDGFVYISVEDSGVGMCEKDVKHVFERFWRADDARDRATGGVGIGLPITKEIINRHNGEIFAESTLGVGTTFTIKLPLSK